MVAGEVRRRTAQEVAKVEVLQPHWTVLRAEIGIVLGVALLVYNGGDGHDAVTAVNRASCAAYNSCRGRRLQCVCNAALACNRRLHAVVR